MRQQNLPSRRTRKLVGKVRKAITTPNPPSQRQMAKMFGVSQNTIWKVIAKDLGAKLRRKRKVHSLSNQQAAKRLELGPNLLSRLGPRKLRYILTLDEAWVYTTNVNGKRKVYYEMRGNRTPESWKKFYQQAHPVGVMFVAGICYRGVTTMRFVEPGSKINSSYYIEHVLKPLVEKDIPRLYPGEEHKVVIHHDSAPAHASRKTQQWLEAHHPNFIRKEEWPGNSPDLAPMDFCINGLFKKNLWKRGGTTLTGLKRVMLQEWKKIDLSVIQSALRSWPKRVKLMIERKGFHVEL